MFNGTLTSVAKYLRDSNGKEPSIVESTVDGDTETCYMMFGVDPHESGATGVKGYMRRIIVVTTTGDGGTTETMTIAHAHGRWAHRANQNWVSIAKSINPAEVVLPA